MQSIDISEKQEEEQQENIEATTEEKIEHNFQNYELNQNFTNIPVIQEESYNNNSQTAVENNFTQPQNDNTIQEKLNTFFQNAQPKLFDLWEKRTETNIIAIILIFIFFTGLIFEWVLAIIFSLSALYLAIYELLPIVPQFRQFNSKKIKGIVMAVYGILGAIFFIYGFACDQGKNRWCLFILAGELFALLISYFVIKKLKSVNRGLDVENVNAPQQTNTFEEQMDYEFENTIANKLRQIQAYDQDERKKFLIVLVVSLLILLFIGIIAKITFLQFFFYSTFLLILYEGIENVPFLSNFVEKNQSISILFGVIGLIFQIIVWSTSNENQYLKVMMSGLASMSFACSLSIYYFKKWKILHQTALQNELQSDLLSNQFQINQTMQQQNQSLAIQTNI